MKHRENDLVILLTGTITPNSLTNLSLKDPEIRRQHYLESIRFYLNKTALKIIFVENSGNSLEGFPLHPERIEYLTFQSAPIQPDRGIGYKELEIMDFAFQNSVFLSRANMVVKITGRLKVLNLNRLSSKFRRLNHRKKGVVFAHIFKPKNMDARCFFFTKDFWPFLEHRGRKIDRWYNFELALWDTCLEYQKVSGKSYIPLNPPLRIKGISGSFGISYKHNLLFHYARFLRNYSKRILGKNSLPK